MPYRSTPSKRNDLASVMALCFTSQIGTSGAFLSSSAGRTSTQASFQPYKTVVSRTTLWEKNAQEESSPAPETNHESGSQEVDEEEALKNSSLLRLALLSLEDYEWRSSVFKSTEADRRVEESLARMMGDEAAYVRPMDASEAKIGPLVGDVVQLYYFILYSRRGPCVSCSVFSCLDPYFRRVCLKNLALVG
jgi:hypothetical protein